MGINVHLLNFFQYINPQLLLFLVYRDMTDVYTIMLNQGSSGKESHSGPLV